MGFKLSTITKEANFLSLAGNLSISLFGIVGFAIMARSFDSKVFGEWVLFISGVAFVEMFRFGITNTAIVRYLSGSEPDQRIKLLGSNTFISLLASIGIALVMLISYYFFRENIDEAGYRLFFKWYPLLVFVNLPYNTALVILQADLRFDNIFIVRMIESSGFFLVQVINFVYFRWSLEVLIWFYLGMNVVTSAYSIFKGWDGMRFLPKYSKETNKTILDFGKYTTFTMVFTNMLRNADAFLISLSPLGTAAVALYSIPMKLTELQQLPLRSFAATAFPKMSKASMQSQQEDVKRLFDTYTGALTYLFIGMSLFIFIFAEFLVVLLGGSQYAGTDPITGANTATILRIFSLYGLLLPLDRMTGVSLDSINKPDKNTIKVLIMVVTNIIGDLVALFVFHSLEMVAVASVVFTLLGIVLGRYYLNKSFNFSMKDIIKEGFLFYKLLFFKLKYSRKNQTNEGER
jgi:O-antigen/teichoic acid export membrane protein